MNKKVKKKNLNPITFEGEPVTLVWRAVVFLQNIVQVKAVHEALSARVSAAVPDQVPGQHLLHDRYRFPFR